MLDFSGSQKSNLHMDVSGRTKMAPHESIEHIELHMRIFFKDNTKMQLLTISFFDILTRTEIASI